MKSVDKLAAEALRLDEIFDESLTSVLPDSDFQAIQAESIGWVYLSEGAYLYEGSDGSGVIQVVGIAKTNMSESNILWLL